MLITDIATARKIAQFARDFAIPDVPRDPAEIIGTEVPAELVALAAS